MLVKGLQKIFQKWYECIVGNTLPNVGFQFMAIIQNVCAIQRTLPTSFDDVVYGDEICR